MKETISQIQEVYKFLRRLNKKKSKLDTQWNNKTSKRILKGAGEKDRWPNTTIICKVGEEINS